VQASINEAVSSPCFAHMHCRVFKRATMSQPRCPDDCHALLGAAAGALEPSLIV
jgi:hypothetical protein